MKIRSVSIAYSITKSQDEKEKILKLENDMQMLENQINLIPIDFIQASLDQKKGELENRRQDIVEGLLLRSRANWHENGERCSEYFCKLEEKSSINKTISELINEKGNHMSDGFTVDFYKFIWKDIAAFVFRSLYFRYETAHFPEFQTRGVITCIPKESKDRRYMSNWRPISLLNTDLKKASAAIANRFKQVLGCIISDTQKGLMKDRFMGETTRLLYDFMIGH
jgi:hypothetical protein